MTEWHNRLNPEQNNVSHLIEQMTKWQKDGYVDINIWGHLRDVVNPHLLPESRGVKRKLSGASPSVTSMHDPSTSDPSRKKKKLLKSIQNREGKF